MADVWLTSGMIVAALMLLTWLVRGLVGNASIVDIFGAYRLRPGSMSFFLSSDRF